MWWNPEVKRSDLGRYCKQREVGGLSEVAYIICPRNG